MASPFRSRANAAGWSSPRPKQRPGGLTPGYTPVDRRPTRNHPWRPSTRKKIPFKPFGGSRPKYPPFGKRVAGSPVIPTKWGRGLGKIAPWIDVATVATGILFSARSIAPFYDMAGWTQVCSQAGPRETLGGGTTVVGTPLCGTGNQAYFKLVGDAIPATWRTVYFGQIQNPSTHRCRWLEQWTRPVAGKPVPLLPQIVPWDPWADPSPWSPFAPFPLPIPPPISPLADPWNEPTPHGDPHPQPNPRAVPVAPPRVVMPQGIIPAVSIGPGDNSGNDRAEPRPDVHYKRPPSDREKEKKKRLSGAVSAKWQKLFEKTGGRFTEWDDFIAALYKGLPWKMRRWRGEDGVWRDRDHTTARRAERIFNLLGDLNVEKAITEVIKNEASDRAYAKVGQALAGRAREMGYWQGGGGFQLGNSNKVNEQWEFQKKMQQDKFAREYRNQLYPVRVLGPNGWETQWRLRPKTQIPWLRRKSDFQRIDWPSNADWWDMSYPQKVEWLESMDRFYALTADERRALLSGRRDPESVGVGLRDAYYYVDG